MSEHRDSIEHPSFPPRSQAAPPLRRDSSSRPDFSAVPIASTTPVVPPPDTPIAGNGTSKMSVSYGSYHDDTDSGDKEPLIGRSNRRAGFKGHPPSGLSAKHVVLLFVFTIVGLIILISRVSEAPRKQIKHHLSPYLPASFISFLGSTGVTRTAPHPIIPLLEKANTKWSSLVTSQSVTFDRATRQYKSRYGSSPPPGFDKWFAFATQGRNHTLVDEYDGLMQDLAPFRSLSPQEIRRRTAELAQIPGISIVSIRDGVAQVHSKSGKWAPARAFQEMLGAFVRDLPNMDIAINERPEGRVLPRRQRAVSMEDYGLDPTDEAPYVDQAFAHPTLTGFTSEWLNDGSVWETYRRSCDPSSASRRLVESVRSAESDSGALAVKRPKGSSSSGHSRRKAAGLPYPPARELTFNAELDNTADFCSRPSLHALHSAFFSDQRAMEHLYPVFSPSKPNGFSDILIPSHSYWTQSSEYTYEWELKRGRTKQPKDLEWNLKKPSIYWRGKVTKGADTPPGRGSSFQKQRIVKFANQATPAEKRIVVAFDADTASLKSASVPKGQANKAVTNIALACDPRLGECTNLRSLGYRVESPGPLSDAWKYKYVLDLDEVGFSPKFLALMESKSAVIKSSVQKEFWNAWAVPWKHFIPLSSAYSEVFNIATFFTGFPDFVNKTNSTNIVTLTRPSPVPPLPTTADGQPFNSDKALQDIAQAGRDWRLTHVRKADMECYVYRLMIEWAALLATE